MFDLSEAAKRQSSDIALSLIATTIHENAATEPTRSEIIELVDCALTLHAVFRVLIPLKERAANWNPEIPSVNAPLFLSHAQVLWQEVYDGAQESTPEQKTRAFTILATAADHFRKNGFNGLAISIDEFRYFQMLETRTTAS
jgi:hypothetical protein